MKRFREFLALIFPLRTHLEMEIEYLKGQLAQERRRNDELRQSLVEVKMPKLVVRDVPRETFPVKPQGWDAFRRAYYAAEESEAGDVQASASAGA